MILKLQEYDFDLYFTPGKDNVADAITRPPIANVSEEQPQKRKEKALKKSVALDTVVQGMITLTEIPSNQYESIPLQSLHTSCIAAFTSSTKLAN